MHLEKIKDNFHCLHLSGPMRIWFSYETPIAYQVASGPHVRKNDWGPTTGKHLNHIDGGAKVGRIDGEKFEEMLKTAPLSQ